MSASLTSEKLSEKQPPMSTDERRCGSNQFHVVHIRIYLRSSASDYRKREKDVAIDRRPEYRSTRAAQ
jgi:hypothetical protein